MPPQIKRLLFVFIVLIGLFVGIRYILVPQSFGKYGHYRADSIEEVKALALNYADPSACKACHEDVVKIKQASRHASIACETCHGPAMRHTEDPTAYRPDRPRGGSGFCGICHAKNMARPKMVPQVDLDEHNVGMECFLCHKAHNPGME